MFSDFVHVGMLIAGLQVARVREKYLEMDNFPKLENGQGFCSSFNPIALRKAKIVCNFGLSECNRIKEQNFELKGWNFVLYS